MNTHNVLRKLINKFGWDLIRHRNYIETINLFNFDLVIDVGANEGQFVEQLRYYDYKGSIISYEPCSVPFKKLLNQQKFDKKWHVINKALGEIKSKEEINAYSDTRYSSFFKLHAVALEHTTEIVDVVALDDEFKENGSLFAPHKNIFLKIDTQGFEKNVLLGAEDALNKITGVLLECSLTPIYENQWVIEDAISFMRERGFSPWLMKRGFMKGAREMEVDCIFYKDDVDKT